MRYTTKARDAVKVVGFLMTAIQIVAIATVVVLLHQVTPLPFWVCVVFSVPLALVLFWGILLLLTSNTARKPPGGLDVA